MRTNRRELSKREIEEKVERSFRRQGSKRHVRNRQVEESCQKDRSKRAAVCISTVYVIFTYLLTYVRRYVWKRYLVRYR